LIAVRSESVHEYERRARACAREELEIGAPHGDAAPRGSLGQAGQQGIASVGEELDQERGGHGHACGRRQDGAGEDDGDQEENEAGGEAGADEPTSD
jgi:hypothetical protein